MFRGGRAALAANSLYEEGRGPFLSSVRQRLIDEDYDDR